MDREITPLATLQRPGRPYDLQVKVQRLYREVRSEKKAQAGILSDESGELRFVVWADSGLELLREGTSYLLQNAKLNEYRGKLEVHLDRYSQVSIQARAAGQGPARARAAADGAEAAPVPAEGASEELARLRAAAAQAAERQAAEAREEAARAGAEAMAGEIAAVQREAQATLAAMAEAAKLQADQERQQRASLERELAEKKRAVELAAARVRDEEEWARRQSLELEERRREVEEQRREVEAANRRLAEARRGSLARLAFWATGAVCLATFSLLGILHVQDFLSRIVPEVNDVIEYQVDGQKVPFQVVQDDKTSNEIVVRSLDEYHEEIRLERRLPLAKVENPDTPDLRARGWNGRSVVYTYRPDKKADYGRPDIDSMVIHVNSEQRDEVLKKLPGIGAVRVADLKAARPFDSLEDVLHARIGVGNVYAKQWKRGIEKGTIVFD